MRILFIRFPFESGLGGAEIQTLSLMEGLRAKGHAVAFLGSCPVLLREAKARHFPVVELSIGAPPVTKWHALTLLARATGIKRQLLKTLANFSDLDAVFMLSMTEKLLVTNDLAARGPKIFWIEHDRVGRWLTKNPWLPMLKRQSKRATTVTVSELSRQIYIDLGWDPKRVLAIPNGIDEKRFEQPEDDSRVMSHARQHHSNLQTQDSALHLGCVARLSPEKGVGVLLSAIDDVPNVRLEIIGAGPQASIIQAHATMLTQHGMPVTVRPTVDDLGAFYRSLDALVLPSSDHDPFGMVAAEAMMLGVPVIVTDACGIAGYVRDGEDALIVPAGDAKSLRQAIEQLHDTALRRQIGEAGRRTAEQRFTVRTMLQEYDQLLMIQP